MKAMKRHLHAAAERICRLGRLATCPGRALPDFIIAGAQKAGTTSLYAYLAQHPGVHSAGVKEIHFFDRRYYRGELFYRSYFPLQRSIGEGEITGEGSPAYLVSPFVAKRISKMIPDVKIIILLRDPVKRAVSSYFHQFRAGREKLSMREAFDTEEQRIGPAREILEKRTLFTEWAARQFSRYSYRTKGIYVRQIEEYFKHFDTSQFFIESSETFFKNTEDTLKRAFEFLGIDSSFIVPDLSPKMAGKRKDKDKIDESVIQELREFYKPYNEELYKLLDRDFGWD